MMFPLSSFMWNSLTNLNLSNCFGFISFIRSISSVCITDLSNPSFKFHESFKKNELPIWTFLDFSPKTTYFGLTKLLPIGRNYYLPLGRKIFTYLGFSIHYILYRHPGRVLHRVPLHSPVDSTNFWVDDFERMRSSGDHSHILGMYSSHLIMSQWIGEWN